MKYKNLFSTLILFLLFLNGYSQSKSHMEYNKLTPEEEKVILKKGTERPFTGLYNDFYEPGTYYCKRCDAPLYRSSSKFHSGCGWPAFDDEIPGAIKHLPDADGRRTEIVCAKCGAHLGHVFKGEGLTSKNVRHCVNSISLKFVPEKPESATDTCYFASGCFWGTEHFLGKAKGVISTTVGYMGGHKDNPTYQEVSSHKTGHVETVQVIYNPKETTYENLAKLFFETHDFTQTNGQGPDIGPQYLSVIFYLTPQQKTVAEHLKEILTQKGYKVATKITKATTFWPAENYHQDYYEKKGGTPYCHTYRKIF